MQWHGSLLPRLHSFLPAGVILEIGCGFGRWTRFLKDHGDRVLGVDLSGKAIRHCEERFRDEASLSFLLNDGTSLDPIESGTVDLVFSFDSLVHADADVLDSYLAQLPRILTDEGAVFLHHSNLGEYPYYRHLQERFPRVRAALARLRLIEKDLQWRDPGVTARGVEESARRHGLQCIGQELLPWGTRRATIDCISTMVKKGSRRARPNRRWRNRFFNREASQLERLARLYGLPGGDTASD